MARQLTCGAEDTSISTAQLAIEYITTRPAAGPGHRGKMCVS